MTYFKDLKFPFIPREEIWKKADDFYQTYWNKRDLPVDLELIIEKMVLDIIPKSSLSDAIDAYLKLDDKDQGIVVNLKTYMDDRYSNRLRFSFAHEIGHYILHRKIWEKMGKIADEFSEETCFDEYYNAFIEFFPQEQWGSLEYQADEFAGRLLVPPDRLKIEVQKIKEELKQANLLSQLIADPDQVLSYVSSKLCRPFGVSTKVVEIRIKIEKLWPPK